MPLLTTRRLGPISVEPKARKATQRAAKTKDPVAPVVRPEEVEDAGAQTHSMVAETERNIKVMRRALTKLGVVDAMELVYNGESFAQTVENLFTLSFMVKDGLVKLTRGARGESVQAQLVERPTAGDFASRAAEASQFMLRFTFADWQAAQARMPREPRISTRPNIQEQQRNAAAAAAVAEPEEGGHGGARSKDAPRPSSKRIRFQGEEEELDEDAEDEEDEPVAKKRR